MTDIEKVKICNHVWTGHKRCEELECKYCGFVSYDTYICRSCGILITDKNVKCTKCEITLIEWKKIENKRLDIDVTQLMGKFIDERGSPGI